MVSRRRFLKQIAWGIPGSCLASSLFSCSKEALFGSVSYDGHVGVIGAGISGLHASALLRNQGIRFTLLEANDVIGGRISSEGPNVRSSESTPPLIGSAPIELGADLIYDSSHLFYNTIRTYSSDIRTFSDRSSYILGSTFPQEDFFSSDVYRKYLELRGFIDSYEGDNQLIEAFVLARRQQELSESTQSQEEIIRLYGGAVVVLNTTLSAIYGIGIDRLTIHEYQYINREKTYGDVLFYLEDSALLSALQVQYAGVLQNTRFNVEVTSIDYSSDNVLVRTRRGDNFEFDKLIVAVPVSALSGGIAFTPVLPEEKIASLNDIGFSPCVKLIMHFRERFWGEGQGTLYLSSSFQRMVLHPTLPYISFYAYSNNAAMATSAEFLSNEAKALLDSLYGSSAASSNFIASRFAPWTANGSINRFIPGAFSYLLPNAASNVREILGRPIGDKVFFAGEAVHSKGHAATLHGAMETGYKAVHDLLQTL